LCPSFILQERKKKTLLACVGVIHVFPGGTMCDLNAYIYQEGKEDLYLENVNTAKSEEGKVYLRNLFGEQKVFEGTIQEISLSGHRIILAKR
jgi:predicted RNA-binding protein